MKMTLLLKGAVCLLAGGLSLTAATTTLTGTISDDMCGADHSGMPHSGKKIDARDCALECAKAGSKFVFVSGGNLYAIANQNLADLSAHAGHNVKVTGDLSSDGKTLTVTKVEMLH
ncbi:MAG TPA: hypothetical protein VK604_13845 [Bryobacteraceae bacterium]|nr:hypothetical protein [Bryobacteraceae bacterium]